MKSVDDNIFFWLHLIRLFLVKRRPIKTIYSTSVHEETRGQSGKIIRHNKTKTQGRWRWQQRGKCSRMFDSCLSQLTCKIFETGTNANSADLLAPKTPEGFSVSPLSQWWGAQSRMNIRSGLWMAQCVRAKQRAMKWRLRTLQAAYHCVELGFGCFHSTKLTTNATIHCLAEPVSALVPNKIQNGKWNDKLSQNMLTLNIPACGKHVDTAMIKRPVRLFLRTERWEMRSQTFS